MSPRRIRLAAFDLDGVLVKERSSWAYLHRFFGSYEAVRKANYTKLFEEGVISYSDWMRLDLEAIVRARKVVYCREVEEAFKFVELAEGVWELINFLRGSNVRVAIVSSGIDVLAARVASILGIEEVHANRIVCDNNGVLAPYGIEVVNPLRKGDVVAGIAAKYGIPLSETMYVGDSLWDCSAFSVVGLPVVLGDWNVKCSGGFELIYVSNVLELTHLLRRLIGEEGSAGTQVHLATP